MLPFGSFLTQIPLILLAAIYMLYLGACTLNRTNAKEADIKLEAKEISVKDSPEKSQIRTFFFHNVNKFKGEALASATLKIIVPDELSLSRLFQLQNEDPSSSFFSYSLFSRPPPVIA